MADMKIIDKRPKVRIVTNGHAFSIEREVWVEALQPRSFFGKRDSSCWSFWAPVGNPNNSYALDTKHYLENDRHLYPTREAAEESVRLIFNLWENRETLRNWKVVKQYD